MCLFSLLFLFFSAGYLELNEMLKEHGMWFPLDPGPGASLGGMCSCSCSGSTAVRCVPLLTAFSSEHLGCTHAQQ